MADDEIHYVLVRSPEHLSGEGCIGYGWDADDFRGFASETELIARFKGRCGRRLNQIRRYYNLKTGDIVVVPVSRAILIGRVTGERTFHPQARDARRSANRLSVDFVRAPGSSKPARIPRVDIKGGFAGRLRIRQAIVDLNRFRPEIDQLVRNIESNRGTDRKAAYDRRNDKALERFRDELGRRLTNGDNFLQAGGRGLELLVRALLECEGYDVEILGKKGQPRGVDIDLEATMGGIVSYKLLVQVKHHRNVSGEHGINQLVNHITAHQDDDQDTNQVTAYLFVTTADDIEEAARKLAEDNDIFIVNHATLVEWITDRISEMPPDALASLNVANAPQFLG